MLVAGPLLCFKKYACFVSSTFIRNTRLKLAKNQEKSKQHTEAQLSLFENYSISSYTSSKNNVHILKNMLKTTAYILTRVIQK